MYQEFRNSKYFQNSFAHNFLLLSDRSVVTSSAPILMENNNNTKNKKNAPKLFPPKIISSETGEEITADEFKSLLEAAPCGKNDTTVIDTNARRTSRIADLSKIQVEWNEGLEDAISKIEQHLLTSPQNILVPKKIVRADLHSVLLYNEGDFFKLHRDSKKSPNHELTLSVNAKLSRGVLSKVKFAGGALRFPQVDDDDDFQEEEQLNNNLEADFFCHEDDSNVSGKKSKDFVNAQTGLGRGSTWTDTTTPGAWAAWFAAEPHEISKVHSGCRIAITYNLMTEEISQNNNNNDNNQQQPSISTSLIDFSSRILRQVMTRNKRQNVIPLTKTKIGVILCHQYSTDGNEEVPRSSIRGRDAVIVRGLENGILFPNNTSKTRHVQLLPISLIVEQPRYDHAQVNNVSQSLSFGKFDPNATSGNCFLPPPIHPLMQGAAEEIANLTCQLAFPIGVRPNVVEPKPQELSKYDYCFAMDPFKGEPLHCPLIPPPYRAPGCPPPPPRSAPPIFHRPDNGRKYDDPVYGGEDQTARSHMQNIATAYTTTKTNSNATVTRADKDNFLIQLDKGLRRFRQGLLTQFVEEYAKESVGEELSNLLFDQSSILAVSNLQSLQQPHKSAETKNKTDEKDDDVNFRNRKKNNKNSKSNMFKAQNSEFCFRDEAAMEEATDSSLADLAETVDAKMKQLIGTSRICNNNANSAMHGHCAESLANPGLAFAKLAPRVPFKDPALVLATAAEPQKINNNNNNAAVKTPIVLGLVGGVRAVKIVKVTAAEQFDLEEKQERELKERHKIETVDNTENEQQQYPVTIGQQDQLRQRQQQGLETRFFYSNDGDSQVAAKPLRNIELANGVGGFLRAAGIVHPRGRNNNTINNNNDDDDDENEDDDSTDEGSSQQILWGNEEMFVQYWLKTTLAVIDLEHFDENGDKKSGARRQREEESY